jgi:hypothetical protein
MEYRTIYFDGKSIELERVLNEWAKGGWHPILVVHDTIVFERTKAN